MLLVPLAVTAIALLLYARLRAGMLAVIIAIAYACLRFPLDSLRIRATEPLHAGLTAGQWGCLGMLAVAIYGLVRIKSPPATATA